MINLDRRAGILRVDPRRLVLGGLEGPQGLHSHASIGRDLSCCSLDALGFRNLTCYRCNVAVLSLAKVRLADVATYGDDSMGP